MSVKINEEQAGRQVARFDALSPYVIGGSEYNSAVAQRYAEALRLHNAGVDASEILATAERLAGITSASLAPVSDVATTTATVQASPPATLATLTVEYTPEGGVRLIGGDESLKPIMGAQRDGGVGGWRFAKWVKSATGGGTWIMQGTAGQSLSERHSARMIETGLRLEKAGYPVIVSGAETSAPVAQAEPKRRGRKASTVKITPATQAPEVTPTAKPKATDVACREVWQKAQALFDNGDDAAALTVIGVGALVDPTFTLGGKSWAEIADIIRNPDSAQASAPAQATRKGRKGRTAPESATRHLSAVPAGPSVTPVKPVLAPAQPNGRGYAIPAGSSVKEQATLLRKALGTAILGCHVFKGVGAVTVTGPDGSAATWKTVESVVANTYGMVLPVALAA